MKTCVGASTAERVLFKVGIRVDEERSVWENEAVWWEERGAGGGERGMCTPECDKGRVVCKKRYMGVDITEKIWSLRGVVSHASQETPRILLESWPVNTEAIYSERSTYTPPKSPNKSLACILVSRVHWANPGPEEETISDMGGKSFMSSLTT